MIMENFYGKFEFSNPNIVSLLKSCRADAPKKKKLLT
jgi:hypothetical protein